MLHEGREDGDGERRVLVAHARGGPVHHEAELASRPVRHAEVPDGRLGVVDDEAPPRLGRNLARAVPVREEDGGGAAGSSRCLKKVSSERRAPSLSRMPSTRSSLRHAAVERSAACTPSSARTSAAWPPLARTKRSTSVRLSRRSHASPPAPPSPPPSPASERLARAASTSRASLAEAARHPKERGGGCPSSPSAAPASTAGAAPSAGLAAQLRSKTVTVSPVRPQAQAAASSPCRGCGGEVPWSRLLRPWSSSCLRWPWLRGRQRPQQRHLPRDQRRPSGVHCGEEAHRCRESQ